MGEVDLLSVIDPARDATFLTWEMRPEGLWTSGKPGSGPPAKLEIPHHPPAEYDLVAVTEATTDDCFAFVVPFFGYQASVHFNSYWRWCGFGDGETNLIDGPISHGVPNEIRIRVRRDYIGVDLNGSLFMEHFGSGESTTHPPTDNQDPLNIGLVVYTTEMTYTRLDVIPEPATLSLLALGGLAILRHRRR